MRKRQGCKLKWPLTIKGFSSSATDCYTEEPGFESNKQNFFSVYKLYNHKHSNRTAHNFYGMNIRALKVQSYGACLLTWGVCESAKGAIVWDAPMPALKGRYSCFKIKVNVITESSCAHGTRSAGSLTTGRNTPTTVTRLGQSTLTMPVLHHHHTCYSQLTGKRKNFCSVD